MGSVVQRERNEAAADDEHEADEQRDLDHCDAEDAGHAQIGAERTLRLQPTTGSVAVVAAGGGGQRRDQHEREDHCEVFDDEPADGDAAALALDHVTVLQRLDQHHRGGHREREAEHEAAADVPAQQHCEAEAEAGGAGDLHQRAGNGDGADREQVLEREMEAHAEHQQDHADLGELLGETFVGDEARRVRARRRCRPSR